MRITYRYIIVDGKRYERQVWPAVQSWQDWLKNAMLKPGKHLVQLEKDRPGEYCRPFTYIAQ